MSTIILHFLYNSSFYFYVYFNVFWNTAYKLHNMLQCCTDTIIHSSEYRPNLYTFYCIKQNEGILFN